jgi:hypothetical protein
MSLCSTLSAYQQTISLMSDLTATIGNPSLSSNNIFLQNRLTYYNVASAYNNTIWTNTSSYYYILSTYTDQNYGIYTLGGNLTAWTIFQAMTADNHSYQQTFQESYSSISSNTLYISTNILQTISLSTITSYASSFYFVNTYLYTPIEDTTYPIGLYYTALNYLSSVNYTQKLINFLGWKELVEISYLV